MNKEGEMLKKGDTIKCSSSDEAVDLMHTLDLEGYNTDFLYEKDGEKGLWIAILEVPK